MIYIGYVLPAQGFDFSYEIIQKLSTNQNKKYKLSTLRKEYSVLKKDDYIEFKNRYRKPVPVLTQKGKLAIKTRLPFKSYGAWDQRWRMVIFDIPERERQYRWALRHKLNELGFGQIQKSSYISPYPLLGSINRFATDLGVRQNLRLFEIERIDDEKNLIEKVWHITQVNTRYQEFTKICQRKLKSPKSVYWPLKAKRLEQQFVEIYQSDPHLPEKFLPKNWAGKNAYKIFKEISNSY